MKYRDHISSIFLAGVGIFLATNGLLLGLKKDNTVGVGFFPFWVGAILIFISLLLLMQALRENPLREGQKFWETPGGWKKVMCAVGSVVVFTLIVKNVGFLFSTFFLLLFLFRILAKMRWWAAGCGAASAALIAYLIFQILLEGSLPVSPLGF